MRQRKSRATGGGVLGSDIQEKLSSGYRRFLASVRGIGSDNRSGAGALARRAADALLDYTESLPADGFLGALERAGRELAAAQPAMAPVFQLANRVLLAVSGCRDGRLAKAAARRECRAFLRRLEAGGSRVRRGAAALIRQESVVLTHSFSETVLGALLAARRAGKGFRVICTESRPVCEGRAMALKLAAHGIPVTLIVDAAAFLYLRSAGLVLVGADSVSTGGLVNKAGTALLAAGARKLGVPVYALADSTKLYPGTGSPLIQTPRTSREVLPKRIRGVAVENMYFDVTPLGWLSGVVTEDGLMSPVALRRRLRSMKVHPAMKNIRPADPCPPGSGAGLSQRWNRR